MKCKKCNCEIPDNSTYCNLCGRKQTTERKTKVRGNGQGTVYKLKNGKYIAVVTLGYHTENGKLRRTTRSRVFTLRKDAVAALPELQNAPRSKKQDKTFKALYDEWIQTHKASKSTIDCYVHAFKHFRSIWHFKMADIDIDDLQECIDSCGKGRRTQENMRCVCSFIYKYGIPRGVIPDNLNLAPFIKVDGASAAHRMSFTSNEISRIKSLIGFVPYADYVYCLIYLGFRPSEFLSLDISQYNRDEQYFVGGSKTAAGTNRVVTISPKIERYVDFLTGSRESGPVFPSASGGTMTLKTFTAAFYSVLEAAGIDNPLIEDVTGRKVHKYTPHSCRHTFATLMKHIDAPAKDKQALIGHTSEEMLKYYQDVTIADLKQITNLI